MINIIEIRYFSLCAKALLVRGCLGSGNCVAVVRCER